MWKKFAGWYRCYDDETLRVLAHPDTAAQLPHGWRRWVALRLVTLTPIERQQFHAFMLKYRGAGFYLAAARLVLLFSIVGVVLHLLLPDKVGWTKAVVLSNVLGLAMAWGVLGVWFNYRKLAQKKFKTLLLLLLVPALGGVAIGVLRAILEGNSSIGVAIERGARVGGWAALTAGLVYMIPMTIVVLWRNRQYEALALQLQQDAERDRLARELSESQLRLLRAQIEPHFLFNTLGAVQQLAEQGASGAVQAAALTANLIAFLRASLAEMRADQVPLQTEFDVVQAYLQVMQVRMGTRLSFRLDLPPGLAQMQVPSMILLTLVENAIKHGIEPSLRGGEIAVSALLDADGAMRLRVQDTGVGLGAASAAGGGLGLENVRRRLQLAAAAASLHVQNREDEGVLAEIVLPMNIKELAA
ncbi:sensor histidine kinase [Janthinobacterium sp. GMG1]|jgi:signal transduction histidine kinase|uniref:sensor histidine kinase n=1 Tax=Janthinobacterium sp. GMG1 TaxID=3096007 RepID=UPI002ACA5F9F|nr:histidine kinase [Janthinobacterium sp. GMG1]MDZ5636505.1 histidine kinase [Janthinobacterium sp. GMG1]